MTRIDKDMVLQVAKLARLKLDDDEIEYYQSQLSKVIEHFSEIDKATDSLGDSWRFDIQGETSPERADEAETSSILSDVLEEAPQTVGSSFHVPRIIE